MATKSVQNLKGEISVIQREVEFWFNRVLEIENEHNKLERDVYGNHNERLEELEKEMAVILKRVKRESSDLEAFRQKYNKEAKKRKMELIK